MKVAMSNENAIEVSADDVNQRMTENPAGADWLLLDCREQSEYDTACIAGSSLIPMNEIPDRVSEIEAYRSKPIVVFCHGGIRSLRVTNWLREQGFNSAQSMIGGIDAWSQEIDSNVPRY